MTAEDLGKLVSLLESVESAEENTGFFLTGTVLLARNDGQPIARLRLRGTGNHELIVLP